MIFTLAMSLTGIFFVGLSIFGIARFTLIARNAEPVDLKIVKIEEEDLNDSLFMIPTYEIVSKNHLGHLCKSSAPMGDNLFKVGDLTTGLFNAKTNQLIQDNDFKDGKWMVFWGAAIGVALIATAFLWR